MSLLDDPKSIEECDKSGMIDLLRSFPDQCRDARSIGIAFKVPAYLKTGFRNIVCSGLGGSVIGPEMLKSYLWQESRIPIFVNRNYLLPGFVDRHTLVIISSYSGNTEETISAYKDAGKRKARIVLVTSGGILKKAALKEGVNVITIPSGIQPRCAVGYSFFTILALLCKVGIVRDRAHDIEETISVLRLIEKNRIGPDVPEKMNIAKQIASDLYDRFPVIYASQDRLDCIAARWRGQLAENAKSLSSAGSLPEMNHNEIAGWQNPENLLKNFTAVMLKDAGDHARILKRIDVTSAILRKEGFRVIEVSSVGRSSLARMFSLLYTGDFVSFYLAILNRNDPTPVDRIAFIKKNISR